jgi:hypothetical protein
MTIQRKLALEWEQNIADSIAERDTQAETTYGPIRDIVARPVARVADRINQDIVRLSEILSLKNVEQFTVSELDDIAFNSQITRGTGAPATGVVSLLSSSPPNANLTVSINFPFSTDSDPVTNQVIFFRATQQVTYIAANASAYYDAANRLYRLDVPVECVSAGTFGIVGPNRIVKSQRSIGSFQRVTNFAGTSGGTDQESNTSLSETLLIFNLGINDISTPFGTELETKRQFPTIEDQVVVWGADPLLVRASTDAGAADVYIIGETAKGQTDTFIYVGQDMVLTKQPALSITSVTSGATTYIQGTHYELIQDVGAYGGSTKGIDAVRFPPTSPLFPAIGDTVTVIYNYNELIQTLQDFFTSDEFSVIGRDLLYKQGIKIPIQVLGTLYVLPGFDPAVVRSNVVSAIATFINELKLGDDVEQFDLLAEVGAKVGSLGGVDNLVLTGLNLVGVSGIIDIGISKAEYARIDTTNITVVFG